MPDVESDVLELRQTGAHLSVHERVSWTGADGSTKRSAAFAIYEVRDELIRRVWYFPAGE